MNTQELLSMLKIVGATFFGMLAMHGYMTSEQVTAIMGDLTVAVPALISAGSIVWSIYAHWNMKKVPENSVAISPNAITGAPVVGTTVLLPTTAKVVGALLAAIVLSNLIPSDAQAQVKLVKPTGNIQADIAAATARPNVDGIPLTGNIEKDAQALWKKIQGLTKADLNYAIAKATAAKTNGSAIRLQCLQAISDANAQANGDGLLGPDGKTLDRPDPAIVTAIEDVAELVDNLSPQGKLFTSCAGAAQMLKTNTLALINGIVTGAAGIAALPAGL